MSFTYEVTLFCDECGDFLESTGVTRKSYTQSSVMDENYISSQTS